MNYRIGLALFGLLMTGLFTSGVQAGIVSADLSITKTGSLPPAIPGQTINYTISVGNAGPEDAPNSVVVDAFPAGLSCSWTCVASAGSSCTAGGVGDINDLASVIVGGNVTYSVICDIDPAATGTLNNTATVTEDASITDPNQTNNSDTASTPLQPTADLSITKTDNQVVHTAGDPITYIIVASNAGPSTVSDAVVSDIFQAPLENCSWTSVAAGGASGNSNASGDLNDVLVMPAGSSVTYEVVCDVALDGSGTLSNTATIASATADDPTPGNASATDDDTVLFSAFPIPTLGNAGLAILLALLAMIGLGALKRRMN